MADERVAKDSTALDEATDRVIREMTQVDMSDDAVTRVMARVRAARGGAVDGLAAGAAAGIAAEANHSAGRGWFGTLLEPRTSWATVAAAATLAAFVAAGVTAVVMGRDPYNAAPLVATALPAPAGDAHGASALGPAQSLTASTDASRGAGAAAAGSSKSLHTPAASAGASTTSAATNAAPPTAATNAAAAPASANPPGAGPLAHAPDQAASGAAGATRVVSDAAAAARVEHPRRGRVKSAGDSTVTAAMVATPDEEQPRQEAGRPGPQDVRLDVTINDQSGSGKPVAKTVTMVVADRESGSIRSQTRMPFRLPVRPADPSGPPPPEAWNTENLPLNVDAWPTILPDGRVRVKLVLSYRTASSMPGAASAPMAMATVEKNLIAVLSDGKPLVVSESADAATDRKVTVEVKATIQK
jgi:hypothetical protein